MNRKAPLRPLWFVLTTVAFCAFGAFCGEVTAQARPDGYVSVAVDHLPNAPAPATELRARLFAEEKFTLGRFTVRLAGFAEGLVADRGRGTTSRDAVARPQEACVEIAGARADLRAGYSRIIWGRLDEIQPTDVVNPLDLARFFLEGRSEARLAVPLVRGRVFFGERATIDAVLVPKFTRGTFDLMEADTSPFDLERDRVVCLAIGVCPPLETEVLEPPASLRNLQGGARVSATNGRVDWSAAAYRGFDAFGVYEVVPLDPRAFTPVLRAVRTFPRFTMVGGDFETARGRWALRGEAAVIQGDVDRREAGLGFDRRAGQYHVSGTVLVHRESAPGAEPHTAASLVASADRTFAREKYRTRAFAVYNMTDRSAFARNITSVELAENVALEGSVGWFVGRSHDIIGRFADRDFLYARLRVHF
jgi:hypothetical protein